MTFLEESASFRNDDSTSLNFIVFEDVQQKVLLHPSISLLAPLMSSPLVLILFPPLLWPFLVHPPSVSFWKNDRRLCVLCPSHRLPWAALLCLPVFFFFLRCSTILFCVMELRLQNIASVSCIRTSATSDLKIFSNMFFCSFVPFSSCLQRFINFEPGRPR